MARRKRKQLLKVKVAPVSVLAKGACEVGLGASVLPLREGQSMLGHSWAGQAGRLGPERLWARSVHLRAGPGDPGATLVFLDLWSGSVRLWQATLEALRRHGSPVSPERLVLLGTHTHTGPSQYLGSSFYELMGGKLQLGVGYDQGWTDLLAAAIAQSVVEARSRAVPARLAVTRTSLWAVSRNRSQVAFDLTPEALQDLWKTDGYPGADPPAGLDPTQRSIDPRLDSLVVLDLQGQPRGVFSFFGCHATALGPAYQDFHRDWPGVAVDAVAEALGIPAGLGLSGAGDVTPLAPGTEAPTGQGEGLARSVGEAVGKGMVRSVKRAVTVLGSKPLAPLPLAILAGTWTTDAGWDIGVPALAGSEDGRSHLPDWVAHEGWRHTPTNPLDPQSPKVEALGCLQGVLRALGALELLSHHPWHRLQLGGHVVQTVPGEPTGVAAWRVEQAVRAQTGAPSATVAGYSGDYVGYFTTSEEYESQQYEGASTLFGRHALARLITNLVAPGPRLSAEVAGYEAQPALAAARTRVLSALVTRPFTFHTRAPDGSQSLVAVWLEPEAAEASLHLVAARGAPRAPAEVAVLPWRLPDGGRLLAARFPVTSATAEVTLELRRKVVVASRTVGPAASVRVRGPGGPSSRR